VRYSKPVASQYSGYIFYSLRLGKEKCKVL